MAKASKKTTKAAAPKRAKTTKVKAGSPSSDQ